MSESTQLIVVEQLPVITERLRMLSDGIKEQTRNALALACTEETVKQVKAVRADLNNQKNAIDAQRIAVKKAVLEPYERFEAVYKELIAEPFAIADRDLRLRIDAVEEELKQAKRDEAGDFLLELCDSRNVEFAAMWYDATLRKITLSASMKSTKDAIRRFVDRVCSDLELIETQADRDEIVAEFMQCHDAAQAITIVAARHKAIEEQKARQEASAAQKAAREAATTKVEAAAPEHLAPAVTVEYELIQPFTFTAYMTKTQARELKRYFEEREIGYE